MKYAFFSFILFSFFMFTSLANGQNTAPPNELDTEVQVVTVPKWVACTKQGPSILAMINRDFGETIVAIGGGEVNPEDFSKTISQLILLWNSKTRTYSVVEMMPDGGVCVLISGRDLAFLGKFTPDNPGRDMETVKPNAISISYDSNMPVNRPVH